MYIYPQFACFTGTTKVQILTLRAASQALVLHKKALEIKLRVAPQSLAVADSLFNMSMLYEKSHLYTEAVEACQRSLALAIECGGRDHPSALEARDLLRELKHLLKQGH